jgi:hypothetical protein
VITNDFFATIAEMARVRPKTGTDGVSLAPLLTGAGGIARDAIYWYYPHYPGLGIMPMSGVRSVDYKRIEVIDDGGVLQPRRGHR